MGGSACFDGAAAAPLGRTWKQRPPSRGRFSRNGVFEAGAPQGAAELAAGNAASLAMADKEFIASGTKAIFTNACDGMESGKTYAQRRWRIVRNAADNADKGASWCRYSSWYL